MPCHTPEFSRSNHWPIQNIQVYGNTKTKAHTSTEHIANIPYKHGEQTENSTLGLMVKLCCRMDCRLYDSGNYCQANNHWLRKCLEWQANPKVRILGRLVRKFQYQMGQLKKSPLKESIMKERTHLHEATLTQLNARKTF